MNKKILFLTGTRADFGKLKSLIVKIEDSKLLDAHLFVTGMHMLKKYGLTAHEVEKCRFSSIYKYINQNSNDTMDLVLAKTIHGLSDFVKELSPDLIVIHGDRVEAMAGAIVGSLNNILVAHVEGGEVSGTIDELIRHSVSKLAHLHFVCNEGARQRLMQLGEHDSNIHVIGSPDLDIMMSSSLPSIEETKQHYDIPYENYGIFMYHPVTTDIENLPEYIRSSVDALIDSGENYVIVYPNKDSGSEIIMNELKRLENDSKFRIFPSIRFECFLVILKHSKFMVGNSSAGVREAPFYGLPSINIGSRQDNRAESKSIINVNDDKDEILKAINTAKSIKFNPTLEFGTGNSHQMFYDIISSDDFWNVSKQKRFVDFT